MLEEVGKDARYKPVAIVDTNATAARMAQYLLGGSGHKNVPTFSGLTGALSQIEADALIICTPTKTHAEYARMGFVVNMHVLVDKGMTMDWEEGKALVAEADSAWVKFCVAQTYRYHPTEQAISYILGKVDHPHHPGDVRIVDYVHHRYRPDPGTYDYSYAMVWDLGSHHMDSLARWLGKASVVTARSYSAPWTQYVHDANISAFIEFKRGAVCNYVQTNDATISEWKVTLQGDRGTLVLNGHDELRFFPKPTEALATAESESVACDVGEHATPEANILHDFFTYIVEDIEPGISGRRNLRAVALCEGLVRSAKNKRPVELEELK